MKLKFIDKGRYFWVNRKDLQVESDAANWAQISDKCDPEKQIYRHELLLLELILMLQILT